MSNVFAQNTYCTVRPQSSPAEFTGPLPAQTLDRVEGDLEAAQTWPSLWPPAERHDIQTGVSAMDPNCIQNFSSD
jgi:hypothetical protein